ncbi:ankyrin repeat-containing protein BDA1-like [Impatiens glandulifera]|uniref:ankyrin repeat-containing protein BDA1-like n=1 Tax=Impatiens glandulifera TaxID=253017 RepID=UPI001FB05DCA|nr:ankyrin repeat-containing protein BDA1-like [Impatiens glandulifera]
MAGHHDIVKELIIMNRKLAYDLNEDGLSPLHIAAANGDFNIVKELVIINNMVKLCEIEGKDRCIPLHCAVIKGRLDIVNLLIETDPESIEKSTAQGETVLHLAIKNNQFKSLQILLDHLYRMGKFNLLKNKDEQGNTILHLATSRKQYEVIRLLLPKHGVPMVDVNATNEKGQTPLDVLLMNNNNETSNWCDKRMEEILVEAGARKGLDQSSPAEVSSEIYSSWYSYFKYKIGRDSPGDVRNCLLVIAALITTATYQAILSPPGGTWQDNSSIQSGNQPPHIAGRPIMQTYTPLSYYLFLNFNTAGFCASVYMIKLLTFGFPLVLELNIALIAIVLTYQISLITFNHEDFFQLPTLIVTPPKYVSITMVCSAMLMPILMPIVFWHCRRIISICGLKFSREPNLNLTRL